MTSEYVNCKHMTPPNFFNWGPLVSVKFFLQTVVIKEANGLAGLETDTLLVFVSYHTMH